MDPAGGGCVNAGDAMFSTCYCCQEATKALSSHIRLAEFYEFGPNEDSLKCDKQEPVATHVSVRLDRSPAADYT